MEQHGAGNETEREILQKLSEHEARIEAIWKSVEKTRKMFVISMWVILGTVLVPLVIMAFLVPTLLRSYLSGFEGLL